MSSSTSSASSSASASAAASKPAPATATAVSATATATLPSGWVRTFSNSQQRHYYSHKDTKHTQWHFPTASEAADPWMAKRRAEENQQKQQQQQQQQQTAVKQKRPRDDVGVATGPYEQQPTKKKPAINDATNNGRSNGNSNRGTSSISSDNNGADADALLDLADTTNVAIIVPFRDLHSEQHRAAHLGRFVPHMVQFLTSLVRGRQISDFHIYIIEQSDDGRKFNRGKLLNIGFDLARKRNRRTRHDAFIFHDVDLLPQPDLADAYARFPHVPYHIARVWDRYSNNPKYFGGVVSFSSSDFKRINGYPNTFWGWGGEDDELQLRCNALGIKWDWPRPGSGTLVDLEDMTLHEKLTFLKRHREWKCMVKWEALEEHEKTWRLNGLADLTYKVLETTPLDASNSPLSESKATKFTVDVKLNSNHWANDKCSVDYMGG